MLYPVNYRAHIAIDNVSPVIKLTLLCLLCVVLVVQVTALGGKPGVIIPDCEEVLELTVGPDWSELVLATDGLWDIVAPRDLPYVRMLR